MYIWLIYLLTCQLLTKYTKPNAHTPHTVRYTCVSCASGAHNLAPQTEGRSQAEGDRRIVSLIPTVFTQQYYRSNLLYCCVKTVGIDKTEHLTYNIVV